MSDDLTTSDILFNIRNRIVNTSAMAITYRKSWGDDYALRSISEACLPEDLPRKLTVADLSSISDDDLYAMGFREWDKGGPTLIPLWAYPLIADGETLVSIDGDTGVVGEKDEGGREKIDLDVRFGCIAYGFTKAEGRP